MSKCLSLCFRLRCCHLNSFSVRSCGRSILGITALRRCRLDSESWRAWRSWSSVGTVWRVCRSSCPNVAFWNARGSSWRKISSTPYRPRSRSSCGEAIKNKPERDGQRISSLQNIFCWEWKHQILIWREKRAYEGMLWTCTPYTGPEAHANRRHRCQHDERVWKCLCFSGGIMGCVDISNRLFMYYECLCPVVKETHSENGCAS